MNELKRLMLRRLAEIKRHYAMVAPRMAGLPMCHAGLEIDVEIGGWCAFETADHFQGRGLLAGVITPWCINALLLPLVWPLNWPGRTGAEIELSLPAGRFVMLVNETGFLSLSLLAEPRQLEEQAAAQVFVSSALHMLKTAPADLGGSTPKAAPSPAILDKPLSRRGMLGGHQR